MGLDTTHDCWHGPYSSFNRWRTQLAAEIGLPLPLMEGFCPWFEAVVPADKDERIPDDRRRTRYEPIPWPVAGDESLRL